jgi:hypothetical protein
MFCTQCGANVSSGNAFCTGCGAPLAPAPDSPISPDASAKETARLAVEPFVPPSASPSAIPTARPVGKNRLMAAMLSSVVLIAVAMGAYFGRDSIKGIFSKQRSGTSAQVSSAPSPIPSPSPTPAPAPAPAAPNPAPNQASTQAPTSSPKPIPVRTSKPDPTPSPTPKPIQTPASAPIPIASPIPTPTPAPAPTQVHTPKPTPVVQRGVVQWSGEVKKNQRVVIEGGTASEGTVSGRLPRVACTIVVQPSDVSIAEVPAPSNGYDRIVLRFPRKDRMVVTINWELLQ